MGVWTAIFFCGMHQYAHPDDENSAETYKIRRFNLIVIELSIPTSQILSLVAEGSNIVRFPTRLGELSVKKELQSENYIRPCDSCIID